MLSNEEIQAAVPEGATVVSAEEFMVDDKPEGWDVKGLVGSNSATGSGVVAKSRQLRPVPKKLAVICGHKIDAGAFPSINCQQCWNAFFYVNLEMTKTNITVLREGNRAEIEKVHGQKYVKKLLTFVINVFEKYKEAHPVQVDETKEG